MARCRASFAHSGDRCPCVLSVADVALSPQEVDLRRWDDRHTRFLSDGKTRPHAAGSVSRDPLPAARYGECGEVRAESELNRMKKQLVVLLSVRSLLGIGKSWALN